MSHPNPLCRGNPPAPAFRRGHTGDRGQGRWQGQDPQRWHPKPFPLALTPEQVRALTFRAQDAGVVPKPTLRVEAEPVLCCRHRTGSRDPAWTRDRWPRRSGHNTGVTASDANAPGSSEQRPERARGFCSFSWCLGKHSFAGYYFFIWMQTLWVF